MLTAHPTEINRRTLLVKHQEVARRLDDLEQIRRVGGVEVAGRYSLQRGILQYPPPLPPLSCPKTSPRTSAYVVATADKIYRSAPGPG